MIPLILSLSYEEILSRTGLWYLQVRRIRADFIQVYKINCGSSTVSFNRFLGRIAVLCTYVDGPIVTDRVAWSVGPSVTVVSCAKTAELIEMPFGLTMGPRNHVLDVGSDPSTGRGNFKGKWRHVVKYSDSLS